jgi:excisionase family DNA binding protein
MPDQPDAAAAVPASFFLQRFVAGGQAVASELGLDHRSVDVKFLGFLRETSRFGVFTLGPLIIHLARVQELMERTTSKEGEGLTAEEEAAFDEFYALMAQEQARRGGTALTEIGVAPERVEDYVAGGGGSSPDLEALYSPEEAAEYVGVHVETVRSWIRSGRLRAHRPAGQRALRIRASDLTQVLEPLDGPDSG